VFLICSCLGRDVVPCEESALSIVSLLPCIFLFTIDMCIVAILLIMSNISYVSKWQMAFWSYLGGDSSIEYVKCWLKSDKC
jgi:hypothetical protein